MTDSSSQNLSAESGRFLLKLARNTLKKLEPKGTRLPDVREVLPGDLPEEVQEPRGVFVTLHKTHQLRGCIGYVLPVSPLFQSVMENAVNAARRDPRFPPVALEEVGELDIEISVMTLPRQVKDLSEIVAGRHGLIIGRGERRGLLLPQVALEQGWDSATFLMQTCRKAGLSTDAWKEEDTEIEIFEAQIFNERESAE